MFWFINLKGNRCFYSWFELRSEAAIAKYSGKYVFLEFNNPMNNYLKNPGKILEKYLLRSSFLLKALGVQPEMLLKKWSSPRLLNGFQCLLLYDFNYAFLCRKEFFIAFCKWILHFSVILCFMIMSVKLNSIAKTKYS